ncbi:MAG: hypothetical protein KatS3mg062_0020 [Tepidiforma sp.]|nr:MAG: hypothetical protein KatS3mg062_0020 [Tepidiforma sp.]
MTQVVGGGIRRQVSGEQDFRVKAPECLVEGESSECAVFADFNAKRRAFLNTDSAEPGHRGRDQGPGTGRARIGRQCAAPDSDHRSTGRHSGRRAFHHQCFAVPGCWEAFGGLGRAPRRKFERREPGCVFGRSALGLIQAKKPHRYAAIGDGARKRRRHAGFPGSGVG